MRSRTIVVGLLFGLVVACRTVQPVAYDGAALYLENCAACHGATGLGDGPVATSMNALVPDLRRIAERNGGSYPRAAVFAMIDGRAVAAAHGTREMPIWGAQFRAMEGEGPQAERDAVRRIEALVEFLERIQLAN